MFRGALSPHRQPLLDDPQPTPHAPLATTKKPAAASLRNLFFGKDDAQPHEPAVEDPHAPHRNVGSSTRSRTPSQPSNKIAPDAFAVTSPPSTAHQPPPKRAHNPRDTFQRANSHPIRLDASAALSASMAFDPSMSRAAALDVGSFQSQSQRSPVPHHQHQQQSPTKPTTSSMTSSEPPSLRSTVYGSCSHVLSSVMSVLVQTIKTHGVYVDASLVATSSADGMSPPPPTDNNTVRKAKRLYIALLEKAQKERGEWQGFAAAEQTAKKERASSNNNEEQQEEAYRGAENTGENDARAPDESAKGLLTTSLRESSMEERFAVLNELLELSFRNLRVALVAPTAYSKHRYDLAAQSLCCPASLETLLRIGAFVSDLSRDEKRCLLHLLSFWSALCVVDPAHQELKRIVEDKHTLVLSESSDMEFMQHVQRKSAWADLVAIDLLIVMAQYREMIFCDLEFYKIRQEMHIAPLVTEPDVETSQAPSKADSASPEIDASEESLEEFQDDSPPSPQPKLLDSEGSTGEVPQHQPLASEEGAHDDAEIPLAAQPVKEAEETLANVTPSSTCPHEEIHRASLVTAHLGSTAQSPSGQEPAAPTTSLPSPTADQAAASPASKAAADKLKSPRAKGRKTKPSYAAATMVSPRFKRSRLVYPSIHSVAAAVTPRQRRAGGVGAMPVEEALPYVAVALAAASLGVLATVAFYAVRKPSH